MVVQRIMTPTLAHAIYELQIDYEIMLVWLAVLDVMIGDKEERDEITVNRS
jgi:hypothetical protein